MENLYKVLISLLVGFCLLGLTDGPSTNSQSFLIGVLSQLLVKSMRKNQRKNAPPHGRVLNEIENESTTVILTLIQQIGKYGNKTNISNKCSFSFWAQSETVLGPTSGRVVLPQHRTTGLAPGRLVAVPQDGTNPSSGDAIAAHRAHEKLGARRTKVLSAGRAPLPGFEGVVAGGGRWVPPRPGGPVPAQLQATLVMEFFVRPKNN